MSHQRMRSYPAYELEGGGEEMLNSNGTNLTLSKNDHS